VSAALPPLSPNLLLAGAVTATAASLWLLLPRRASGRAARWLGTLFGRLGGLGDEAVFLIVSLVAIVSGAATVVSRSPVYAAIWFALALAGVSGVLLVLGAQFLGVATIVVYAGAILVMFLFVLMLAQPAGLAPYDRVSNEPLLAAVAGAVTATAASLWLLLPRRASGRAARWLGTLFGDAASPGFRPGLPENGTQASDATDPFAENHVARLGGELFGRHLLAVEAAGVLLLVALVGSIAMVSRGATVGRAPAASGTARSPA